MKKTLLHITGVFSLVVCSTLLAKAQDGLMAVEKPIDTATVESGFELGGYVDAYYLYSFNEVPFTTSFTNVHNSFSLGMANLVLSKSGGKFGFVADVAFGPRAEGANGYVDANGKISSLTLIKQLYMTYTPADWLTLTFGNFGTFVGYEVIDSPVNLNYSTSYMFTNGPFYHTGLKANIKLSDKFGALVGVFNDTDTKIDVVPGKHFGAQLSYSDGVLAAYLNFLTGKHSEGEDFGPDIFSNQVDLTATLALGKVGVGVNVTSRMFDPEEGDATSWFGSALYLNFPIGGDSKLALRGEYIGDEDGVITGIGDNSILALTLSGNIKSGPFTFIPEFRIDNSSEEGYFFDVDGKDKKSNAGILFAVIYDF